LNIIIQHCNALYVLHSNIVRLKALLVIMYYKLKNEKNSKRVEQI